MLTVKSVPDGLLAEHSMFVSSEARMVHMPHMHVDESFVLDFDQNRTMTLHSFIVDSHSFSDVPDPAAQSLEDDAGDGSSGGDIDDDEDDFRFREKTYPSNSVQPIHVASQAKQDGAPAFKKRKVNAKRPQFRQRTQNS